MWKAGWTSQDAKESDWDLATWRRPPLANSNRIHNHACKSPTHHTRNEPKAYFLLVAVKFFGCWNSHGKESMPWQLHLVRMSFISVWSVIYLKPLFNIFLSKNIRTVFVFYKSKYISIECLIIIIFSAFFLSECQPQLQSYVSKAFLSEQYWKHIRVCEQLCKHKSAFFWFWKKSVMRQSGKMSRYVFVFPKWKLSDSLNIKVWDFKFNWVHCCFVKLVDR